MRAVLTLAFITFLAGSPGVARGDEPGAAAVSSARAALARVFAGPAAPEGTSAGRADGAVRVCAPAAELQRARAVVDAFRELAGARLLVEVSVSRMPRDLWLEHPDEDGLERAIASGRAAALAAREVVL